MSWHREDYAAFCGKITEAVRAHPIAFVVIGVAIAFFILGGILL